MMLTRRLNLEVKKLWTTMRSIARQKFSLATGFLLFLSFTSLYLFFSPDLVSQPWDSLEYAYAAEAKGIAWIWGNHPLGHVLFSLVFGLAKQLGYQGRALSIFQITNAILGGITIAAFFGILVSIIKVRALYALGFSLVLGASYDYWFFAGTGDIYHFAILCSLLAWAALAYEVIVRNRRYPILSGCIAGLAILFHQLNIISIPAYLALILFAPNTEDQAKRVKLEQISLFTVSAMAFSAVGYLLLGFIATSSFSVTRIIGWMRGYFGDPTYGRYLNLEVFSSAWMTITQAVLFSPENKAIVLSLGLLGFFLLTILIGLFAQKSLAARKRAILKASALQCLITWPLILWWEPQNPKFWLLTLIPFVIFLALSFEAVTIRLGDWPPAFDKGPGYAVNGLPLLFGILILAMNIQHVTENQDAVAFQEALNLWMDNSSPDDVLITAGDLVPQLIYWGKRPNTIYLYRALQTSQASPDRFDQLNKDINQALCAHHTVLITPSATDYIPESELSLIGVSREELRSYLHENARKGEILFWYRNLHDDRLLPVYALRQSVACLDKTSASHLN